MTDDVRRRLPNAITLLRLVLAAGFFAALSVYRYPDTHLVWGNLAIVMFVLAVTTDALDGYLARLWNVQSVFGRIMDPFCDKVLIIGAFVMLAGPAFVLEPDSPVGRNRLIDLHDENAFTLVSGVYPWMVVVVLARELLVTGIRGEVEAMSESFASNWWGKAKMILQSLTIPLVLLIVINIDMTARENLWAVWTRDVLVWITVAVTVLSGWPYIRRASVVFAGRADRQGKAAQ
jgi:CDP-diacylglycerol--glycerol-3-phosphate 3-phosphatidyltransferase